MPTRKRGKQTRAQRTAQSRRDRAFRVRRERESAERKARISAYTRRLSPSTDMYARNQSAQYDEWLREEKLRNFARNMHHLSQIAEKYERVSPHRLSSADVVEDRFLYDMGGLQKTLKRRRKRRRKRN
jgi:hypothetical protein